MHVTKQAIHSFVRNKRKQGDNPKMVNAAQAKQGDLELLLALAWSKQLSNNPKR